MRWACSANHSLSHSWRYIKWGAAYTRCRVFYYIIRQNLWVCHRFACDLDSSMYGICLFVWNFILLVPADHLPRRPDGEAKCGGEEDQAAEWEWRRPRWRWRGSTPTHDERFPVPWRAPGRLQPRQWRHATWRRLHPPRRSTLTHHHSRALGTSLELPFY